MRIGDHAHIKSYISRLNSVKLVASDKVIYGALIYITLDFESSIYIVVHMSNEGEGFFKMLIPVSFKVSAYMFNLSHQEFVVTHE